MARKNNKKLRKSALNSQQNREEQMSKKRESKRKNREVKTLAQARMETETAAAVPQAHIAKKTKKLQRRNRLHAAWAARKGLEATFPIKKDKKLDTNVAQPDTETTMEN